MVMDTRESAVPLLVLPPAGTLSEQQVRGLACVWDGITLSPDTAVDLGPRAVDGADGVLWFPRGCRRCVSEAAHQVLLDHAPLCESCADNAAECPTGRGLYRLIRQGWR